MSAAQRRIFLAGFGLIAIGIVGLYLSDQVVQGWWQATLDAFGVGFIIGGVVDVLAISILNSSMTDEQTKRQRDEHLAEKKREYDVEAEQLLEGLVPEDLGPVRLKDTARAARYLLALSNGQMDSESREGLKDLVNLAEAQARMPPSALDGHP